MITCPLDDVQCDGANGRAGSLACKRACEAGRSFIEGALVRTRAPKLPEQPTPEPVTQESNGKAPARHGRAWWAKVNKCKCTECHAAMTAESKRQWQCVKERKMTMTIDTDSSNTARLGVRSSLEVDT